jgi:hypothetical protein
MMVTTVTELLRSFPKVRRAAMRGERVVIKTRSGNLVLSLEEKPQSPLWGGLKHLAEDNGLRAEEHVFSAEEWSA